VRQGEARVSDFLLYGLDESGRTAHSEVVRGCERSALRPLAEDRLRHWHAVEIWEGPMCVVRLRRDQPRAG
jgi:hypothetical protein